MQNYRAKQYSNDDIDIAKRQKEEEIYERLFKKKVTEQINRSFPTQQDKELFLDQYCMVYNNGIWPFGNRDIEANFNRCIEVFTELSLDGKCGPFKSFFDFVWDASSYIRALKLERNTIYNNFANYLLNNHGNEINNAIQQAQQNMENRLRDEEARFLNNQRIINNQALQNARNEVNNRANAFFQNQENQIQNQMNQIQDRANQFFNNEHQKYLDVLSQNKRKSDENDKLKMYNASLNKENTKLKDLLKLNNKKYIYDKKIFSQKEKQNAVFKSVVKKNNQKLILPKINNYVKNTRDSVDTYALPAKKGNNILL